MFPSALELKVPPIALVLLVGAAMWLASFVAPSLTVSLPYERAIAFTLAVIGLSVVLLGAVAFRRARTTLNPIKPETASALVTTGIYRFTRNPMYLGFALVLLAWAILLGNALAFILLPTFVLYMNRFQIMPEERILSGLFGAKFVAYKRNVRRWV